MARPQSELRYENNEADAVLTKEAREFVTLLHRRFGHERERLLLRRAARQNEIDEGENPGFLQSTENVRRADWSVARVPRDLEKRWVEITGPAERKMMINALNSGADVFMADLEDSFSPTWQNVLEAQANLRDAVRRDLFYVSEAGKRYVLNDHTATLVVRPRGWHLEEKHFLVNGVPVAASLFDFGLFFFHNARELIRRGSGPYFYLPKLENHLEARLWNDVFVFAQNQLGIPNGMVRATVLIETVLAAFEMDEILYELRDHAAGLNAGRWDYLFSTIKKFRKSSDRVFPDRSQLTMDVPFMRAYAKLLVKTCHHRKAHAIGGMAAFIPSRKNADVNRTALERVHADKEREVNDGFDGTWVAHPDLVPVAQEVFMRVLKKEAHQKHVLREDVEVSESELLNFELPGAKVTEDGLRTNISIGLQYIKHWFEGSGAVAINNLMEDAATAEISRAQLWQWISHRTQLDDGREVTPALYAALCSEEISKLDPSQFGDYREAADLLNGLVLNPAFTEFLTIPAYKKGIQ